jgi:hypothetical protein
MDDKEKCNRIFLAAVCLRAKEVEGKSEGQKELVGALQIVGRNDG